jgi:hypothetical protein
MHIIIYGPNRNFFGFFRQIWLQSKSLPGISSVEGMPMHTTDAFLN